MSEVAVPANNEPVPFEVSPSSLVAWAMEARQAAQIAESLSRTSFVPQSLRGKPADITAAILTGQELGLRPMASLRSMDIIQGTPALRAHAMRGLVQSYGHKLKLVESTEERCVYSGLRAGDDDWQTVEWTIKRAAKLGLTGKDQWKKQPQTMLIARATGEICRLIASDVLHAMPYAAEELDPDVPMSSTGGERVTAREILGQDEPAGPEPEPQAVEPEPEPADQSRADDLLAAWQDDEA